MIGSVALSLRQPWAWLVVHGGKNIENRRWNTHRRGYFLIHAAKGMTGAEYEDAIDFVSLVMPELVERIPKPEALERGGLVGAARIVAVLPPTSSRAYVWHMPEQFGFVLRDVHPLPFTPCLGARGFFRLQLTEGLR